MAWATLTGGFLLAGYLGSGKTKDPMKEIKDARQYVQIHNPNKYNQVLANKKMGPNKWLIAAKEIQDSLKIDSIAKTNYALGMQAVRDSLAKTKLR